jgi:hypothetical protein
MTDQIWTQIYVLDFQPLISLPLMPLLDRGLSFHSLTALWEAVSISLKWKYEEK